LVNFTFKSYLFLAGISVHPLVSVVIPTYNRVLLLQKAITSILAQSYTNWELIVVDDGSTDGTSQLIRSMTDRRISVLELHHSGHIGCLRNAGVKACNGEWLAFLDSDDVWVPKKLELQLDALRQSGGKWCYGNFELMNESGQTIPVKAGKYRPLSGWIIRQLLTTEAAVTMCSVMVKRSLFNEVGGFSSDSRLQYRGDYELGLRLALKEEVTALPDVLVRVLEHEGRSTSGLRDGHERTALAYEIFLDAKPGKELRQLANRQLASHLVEAASRRLSSGQYLNASRQFVQAIGKGVGWKQWLSALYRGIRGRFQ
jgi:glycosyltransferase involved in cell wall biosynthesis